MITTGLIHSAFVDQRKRLSSIMPDENFMQSENFCFPPNNFFIFTYVMIFGVILSGKNRGFQHRVYRTPLPYIFLTVMCAAHLLQCCVNMFDCVLRVY